jgi:hypothetical protein
LLGLRLKYFSITYVKMTKPKKSQNAKPTTTSNPSSTRTRKKPNQIDANEEDIYQEKLTFKLPQEVEEPRKRRMASLNAEALMHIYASPAELHNFMTSTATAKRRCESQNSNQKDKKQEQQQKSSNQTHKKSKLDDSNDTENSANSTTMFNVKANEDSDKKIEKESKEPDLIDEIVHKNTNVVKNKRKPVKMPSETNGNKKRENSAKAELMEVVDQPRPKREASEY